MLDKSVLHNLIITGFSENSFDEAVKNAIQGAYANHGDEYEFKNFQASDFEGTIGEDLTLKYSITVQISAVHRNGHDHKHDGNA